MKKNHPLQCAPMTRRGFLKRAGTVTAGAAAFSYIIPSSALGADGAVAPSNRIVMGAIGVGGQGAGNMRQFLNSPGVQMVAVCDCDKGRVEAAKKIVDEKYGDQGCAAYGDFRELLARTDIDAVCIGTPDHWHGLQTIAAAKTGKDIYCEKPLVNTIAEGIAVRDAVNRYGRVLQTGSHERSRDNARYACELVRNGRIGKLHTIHVNLPWDSRDLSALPVPMPVPEGFDYDMWLGPCPWEPYTEKRCHFWFRYILEYSGGEVTDRGAHVIDIGQLGNNSDDTGPVEVTGKGTFLKKGLFDCAVDYQFDFTYANGVRMLCTTNQPRGVKFEGTDGWVFVHIHGGNLEASKPGLLKERIGPEEIHLGRSPGHHADFLRAVRTRGLPFAPVEVGVRTATMCHLANIAMLTGRTIKWDPVKEIITNDDEARKMCARPMRAPWTLT
ncbi:MAG TPA: Gfo/Idh/MocA family oxidoreductase [Candidatus Hydrogenedentes bacterium]|nr:Gfo/Idh/MocA family oxidoreductase [Candidatus Hydrogenedentota bacterium]